MTANEDTQTGSFYNLKIHQIKWKKKHFDILSFQVHKIYFDIKTDFAKTIPHDVYTL
jgi:hypothetical protein